MVTTLEPKLIPVIEPSVCTGCGACVDSCPTRVIMMSEESGKAYVAYLDDCEFCFLCVFDCPWNAIEMMRKGNEILEGILKGT